MERGGIRARVGITKRLALRSNGTYGTYVTYGSAHISPISPMGSYRFAALLVRKPQIQFQYAEPLLPS